MLKIIFEGKFSVPIPSIDIYIDQLEETFFIEEIPVKILHTPGHSPGSVCILVENNIFTGDTLMKGLLGRTDLPGGNKQDLTLSLEKLKDLPGNIIIYPGHGPETILSDECDTINEYLKKQCGT